MKRGREGSRRSGDAVTSDAGWATVGSSNVHETETPPSGAAHVRRVALVGLGDMGVAVLDAALADGIGEVHAADGSIPQAADGFAPLDVLRNRWPAERVVAHGTFTHDATWLGTCDVCVLSLDTVDRDLALTVNSACLAAGTPLLVGLGMGEVAQVGPLIRGGVGPCLRCVELRVSATTGRPALAGGFPRNGELAAEVGRRLATRLAHVDGRVRDDDELLYLWASGWSTRHAVLRSPLCETCASVPPQSPFAHPTPITLRTEPASDRGHIRSVQDRLVDPVAGPIRWIQHYEAPPDEPAVHHVVASLADPGWARHGHPDLRCGGNDLDASAATAAALGEALDRAAASQPPPAALTVAPYDAVTEHAVDPAAFDMFHPTTRTTPGFPYQPITRDAPLSWVWGSSLRTGRPQLVPANRVFAPFQPLTAADITDGPIVSGFATDNTIEEATLAGLLEVIERDSFMVAWATRAHLRKVNVAAGDDSDVARYVSAFHLQHLEVRCSTATFDLGVPFVVAMVQSERPGDPATVVAAAADPDVHQACRKALKELTANYANVRHNLTRVGARVPDPVPEQVVDETDHGLLYARHDMRPAVAHWWNPAETVALDRPLRRPPPADVVRDIVARVAAAGLDVIVVDLTPPAIRPLGLRTVKVLVPGTYPMNFDSRYPHLGGTRLGTASGAGGAAGGPRPLTALNLTPHPFP